MGFPWCLSDKESTCNAEEAVRSLGQEDPLEKKMATHASTLAHGQRSLEDYSSRNHKRVRHNLATKQQG